MFSGDKFVYLCLDGVYFNNRLEIDLQCNLVIIGVKRWDIRTCGSKCCCQRKRNELDSNFTW